MGKFKKFIIILVIIIAILLIWHYINETSKEDAEIEVISNGTWVLTVTIGDETKEYTGNGNKTIDLGKIDVNKNVEFYITSKGEGTTSKGTLYQKGVVINSNSDTYVSTSSTTGDEYTTEYSESTSTQDSYTPTGSSSSESSSSSSSSSGRCWCGAIH